ncbi:MAG TPA: HNH endonuclease [Thermoanaerobaculia bacterium]|nr:HNH endonuclease [Thermoanaerobaculia bacterium]
MLDETRIRLDAIHHVRALRERWVAVPAAELSRFESAGRRIFLKGQQGIFKPAELSEPLSITSTIDSPYNDRPQGSRVLYDFLPPSRQHDNDGLQRCAEAELPLIYLLQVKRRPPEYVVFAPVYVVGWDESERRFLVDLSEQKPGQAVSPAPGTRQLALPVLPTPSSPSEIGELARRYAVATVQRRLHEARFRNAILEAYRERCAVCGLRIRALLDAAHLVPLADPPAPEIVVREGVALCAIHHRAFEAGILTWNDNYVVRIELPERRAPGEGERDLLLAYAGKPLTLPADREHWPLISGRRRAATS